MSLLVAVKEYEFDHCFTLLPVRASQLLSLNILCGEVNGFEMSAYVVRGPGLWWLWRLATPIDLRAVCGCAA